MTLPWNTDGTGSFMSSPLQYSKDSDQIVSSTSKTNLKNLVSDRCTGNSTVRYNLGSVERLSLGSVYLFVPFRNQS